VSAVASVAATKPPKPDVFLHWLDWRSTMGRGLLLWLIGIPIPIILLIWLFGGLH
jgi:hypothetical protein